jgi:hypothetical protein
MKNTIWILTIYRFIDRITFHHRNDHKNSGPSEWNKYLSDKFKLKSHFLFSLPTNSFNAHKQNRSFTLSITSTHLNAIYPNLPALITCILISSLILSITKNTWKIQYGYLPSIDSLIRITFHHRNDHKSSGPSECNRNLSDTLKLRTHFDFSLPTNSFNFFLSRCSQTKQKLQTFNRINTSQYILSKSSETDCLRS